MPSSTQILNELSSIVGSKACLSADATHPFTTDYRSLYRGQASAVVLPASTLEVSRVMAWCYQNDIPVVPQGGNTSLMGGSVPDASGTAVILVLSRMNKVLDIDPENDTLSVQAGVTLSAARSAAATAGKLFPLRIGSEGSCQIGGNLSTNAGGTAVLRYGNMRDLVLGIEAVLPDGRVLSSMRGLRKDNTGYDLKQLFIGAEGTLGIITGAVLKLAPLPTSTAAAFVAVAGPEAALGLLGRLKLVAGNTVSAFELISGPALDLVLEYLGNIASPLPENHPWMVLVELSSGTRVEVLEETLAEVLETGLSDGLVLDAAVATNLSDIQTFWRVREEISDAQTRTGGSIKCDVSVPLSRIAKFIDDASRAVLALEPHTRMVIYGHMGDGNVHFNPLRPKNLSSSDFLGAFYEKMSVTVDDLAHGAGGSVSAEHGIGVAKREALVQYKSAVELELMWQIKRALDPKGLLNPGKLLPRLGDKNSAARANH